MKESLFIQQMVQQAKEASDKVKKEFPVFSLAQLNWHPAPDSWSIGQCFDHLVVTDGLYFPALRKIAEGKYEMNTWEKWSPFSALFGKILVNQSQEKVKKKIKAPKVFVPSSGQIDAGILDRFHKHLDTLTEYIAACDKVDIDRINITSPVSKFVTYSVRNTISILVQHEHRHINQAVRVKSNKEFPA